MDTNNEQTTAATGKGHFTGETIEIIPDFKGMFNMFLTEAERTAEHLTRTDDEEITLADGKGLLAELNIALNAISDDDDRKRFREAFQRIVTRLDDETCKREAAKY